MRRNRERDAPPIINKMMFTHIETSKWGECCTCMIQQEVIPRLEAEIKPIILKGTLEEHIKAIQKENGISYWGTGKGSCDSFRTGNDMKEFLTIQKNLDYMKGRIVHLASCWTGKDGCLGDMIIDNGAITFFGYKELFWVGCYNEGSESGKKPCGEPDENQDYYSAVRSDVEIQIKLGQGYTTGEACQKAIEKYDEFIKKYTIGEWSNREEIAAKMYRCLLQNKRGLCIKGDKYARAWKGEATKPYVSILKPKQGYRYVNDEERRPANFTTIIGKITIEVDAKDDLTGIDKVEIYIDGNLKKTFTEEPYRWLWDEKVRGKHTIEAKAYDKRGNTAIDRREVRIFNLGRNR